ncbi:DUF1771-domain-containing protein [Dentipellis sp. KUC8613]|nr:DUF1771-domain-containing protein [Dentipellis sp. KUC8613]
MGLLDFLGALASCLCGPATSQPPHGQQPEVYQLPPRPPAEQQHAQLQPQARPAPYYPAPQLSFPAPQPQPHPQPEHAQKPHHKPHHQKPKPHRPHEQESYAHAASPPPGPSSPPRVSSPPAPASAHAPVPPQFQRANGQVDPNLVNQANPHYTSLRAAANAAGDAMARAFEESHAAYAGGDGARAKELSNVGKDKQREMERLNGEASEWIFRENNTDSKPGEIDLHGLYVKEAIRFTEQSIQQAQQRGDGEIHLIVGKGLHSAHGAAKLKPAIEELIQKYNLVATLDPSNAGVLIVQLDGQADRQRERGGPSLGADDLTRKIERGEEGCVIM